MWLLAAVLSVSSLRAQQITDLAAPAPLPQGSTLVVGFLGGFDRWDDQHRSVRRLALKLREHPGVYAESISNHQRDIALELIRRSVSAHWRPRIIVYGQSWGGAAAVYLARDLEGLGIPVLLTVQVDSVGLRDGAIPANVLAAVNFYQHDPLTIQGRREIRAADPSRTQILGNFGRSYDLRPLHDPNASWARGTFGGGHAKLELDPVVWSLVEQYITAAMER